MVTSNNQEVAEKLRSLRTHGGVRDLKSRDAWAMKHSDIDSRFLFIHAGYNLRPTEMQAAFGIHQLPQLEKFIEGRRETVAFWNTKFAKYSDYLVLPREELNTRHVWLGYPITVKKDAPFRRGDLTAFLEAKGVETRPIVAGNIAEQPVMKDIKHRIAGALPNARAIHRQGFYIGCQREMGEVAREAIMGYFEEFFKERV